MENEVAVFWKGFLNFMNLPPETKYFEFFSFGVDHKIADELLTLVLNGKKEQRIQVMLSMLIIM